MQRKENVELAELQHRLLCPELAMLAPVLHHLRLQRQDHSAYCVTGDQLAIFYSLKLIKISDDQKMTSLDYE